MTGLAPSIERVAIVGAGLVGSSIALAAARVPGLTISITDADPAVRERVRQLGVARHVPDSVESTVEHADLVIAAVPSRAVASVLEACIRAAPAHAILSDAASLKRDLTLDVESRLMVVGGRAAASRFVPGHPMAGSERSGPDAADALLFQGATWVLTPSGTTDDGALRTVSGFLTQLGARVLAVSPQRHDELVALVSHLPQLAASALADVAADAVEGSGGAVLAVAGGGFRDTTRIAASDPRLWVDILTGNRDAVLEALDAYLGRLGDLRDALDGADEARLSSILSRASDARRRLAPKGGVIDVRDLVIALEDRPGQLAVVTTALGEVGINVEDLAMRHAVDGRRGALVVRVAAEHADRALAILSERGMHLHVESDLAAGADASEGAEG